MKLYKIFIYAFLISGITSSCELDLSPYDSVNLDKDFTSVADAQKWDEGFYADLKGRIYGRHTVITDIQADQLNATPLYGNTYGSVYRWNDFISTTYELEYLWQPYYSALFNLNLALAGFEKIKPKDKKEEENLKAYIGDAHLLRAYYHFLLVLRYAKPYNSTTANSDLGIPLALVADNKLKPKRNTIKEVYDQILVDLNIAKTNLAAFEGRPNSFKFNKDVVLAFEARIKLHMKDWNGAKAAAETLISEKKYKLYDNQDSIKSMWHSDSGREVIFASFASLVEGPANTNNIYLSLNENNKKYRPSFLPSKWVYDSYEDKDFRKSVYFLKDGIVLYNARDYKMILVNKYPGNPKLYDKVTNYAHSQRLFRIAEMYLIAAESAYKATPSDPVSALAHLNTLRVSRGLPAMVGISGEVLWNEIKNERFRELAFEGFRFDDLKRWGEGFTRRSPQLPLDLIETGPEFDAKSVQPNDEKFVWGIPNRDVRANTNLVQNPGW